MSTTLLDRRVEAASATRREAFLKWQCRVRQIAMREAMGRPDGAVMPAVTLPGGSEPLGHVITVMSKAPAFSMTPELRHLAMSTHDPAERREKAVRLFSAAYYQRPREFSDQLTATFPATSKGAAAILTACHCTLTFDAYGQLWWFDCEVAVLAPRHPLYDATWWHNRLFNPSLSADTVILAFAPDWRTARAEPDPAAGNTTT